VAESVGLHAGGLDHGAEPHPPIIGELDEPRSHAADRPDADSAPLSDRTNGDT
jgi:hypothetical protein